MTPFLTWCKKVQLGPGFGIAFPFKKSSAIPNLLRSLLGGFMKKKFTGSLLAALGLMLAFSGSVWAAPEAITVTLSSPQTIYTPGQNNTFTFNVGLAYSGAEYVDRYQFVFPAGVTVVSATPASGAGTCGANDGIQSICGSTVAWGKSGATCSGTFPPTGCGSYTAANTVFTVTAGVPASFTGPMAVTLNSVGDGFGLAAGSLDSDTVTFGQAVPPVVVVPVPASNILGLFALLAGLGLFGAFAVRRFR